MNSNSNMSQKRRNSISTDEHRSGVNNSFPRSLKPGVFGAGILSILVLNFALLAPANADTVSQSEVLDATGLIQQTFSVGREMNPAQSAQGEGVNLDASVQTDNELLQMLTQKKLQLLTSSEGVKSDGMRTREEVILAHKNGQTSSKYAKQKMAGEAAQFANPIFHEFSIYEASSRLFTDNDLDGFYQTFSVTFDADLIGFGSYERADVYAELYLSRDGGPWVHYYSTDIFTIIGDSSDDDFEVLTTLHTGYPADHYDVLIDLYEVGFDDIVATISSDETDNLYALPLESSDRDEIYIGDSSSEGHGGGSLSLLGLLVLGFVSLKRRLV
ncbi:conserved hypothetical protein [Shewanella sediminis HAW-EB3]|uniref:GlyGly-CTERM sorting domain-containing protein n=1 Tax=Shewanella sediminis (strain HAW-EB3) TaxID=425104 RepID=A8FYC5_SHESH|nr:choice-of-anchor H family protein [Shewanella sediminis]ABV37848.1 conserved hypothetical protein [Shewanella sediminis HAW-EB3]